MPDHLNGDVPSPAPRLLDRLRNAIRARHYSPRTVEAYAFWARRFIPFHGKRHPDSNSRNRDSARLLESNSPRGYPATGHVPHPAPLLRDTSVEASYDIRTIQELMGHKDVATTMIYTHVLNRGGRGVQSPLDTIPGALR